MSPAVSEKQQKLFGIAYGIKQGKIPASYSKEAAELASTMTEEDLRDFASKAFDGSVDLLNAFVEKEIKSPFAVATVTAKKMGFKNFDEGSPGRKKRDEITETLKKTDELLEKGGSGSGKRASLKTLRRKYSSAKELPEKYKYGKEGKLKIEEPAMPTPKKPKWWKSEDKNKCDQLDKLNEYLGKAAPGPPPRPGLQWDEQSHRWRKIQVAPEDKKAFSGLLRTQRTKGPEAYKGLSRSELKTAQRGAVHAYHTSTSKRDKTVALATMQRLNTALKGKKATKSMFGDSVDMLNKYLDKGV